MSIKYKRVLIKLSGEALAGEKGFGLDYPTVLDICKNINCILQNYNPIVLYRHK